MKELAATDEFKRLVAVMEDLLVEAEQIHRDILEDESLGIQQVMGVVLSLLTRQLRSS